MWVVVPVLAVGVAGGAVALASRRRGIRRAQERARVTAADTELAQRAGVALVRADERIRLADDELAFAIAEFGDEATAGFARDLQEARSRLREAFRLNQLLSDHAPETEAERRSMNERIIQLCESCEQLLRHHAEEFAARRSASQQLPESIGRLRAEARAAREAIPPMEAKLAALRERYSDDVLAPIATNAAQTRQLLDFAERSLALAEERSTSGRSPDAAKGIQIAAESIKRATSLAGSVDAFEVEALRAETTLSAMVADSANDLADAKLESRTPELGAAISALERAVEDASAPAERRDPFSALATLREANTDLDRVRDGLRTARGAAERTRAQLVTALDDAERQIALAHELIADHRAPIGPDARTRLAEAQRILENITEERDPAAALHAARRAAALAAEARSIAHQDLTHPRTIGGGPSSGAGALTGVIGGLVIGGLLDGFDGVDDLFD